MTLSKSSYIPFARKYRPSNFSELIGQEVLVKTLTNCIKHNHLTHALLLTGIRGVGKTSSARIIAKTVNCTDLQIKDKEIIPCQECKNCESFNKQNHPDIMEIDAASKTSVDDIRRIIENTEYRPLLGKIKFFIIDEVHMLSKSAFNALLKVLEEPPEHVIFILATTEVQKIPLTVISRCQRYDLRRLSFREVYKIISDIAKKENVQFEEEALKIIATKSEGSARDAITMTDQAASYAYSSTSTIITSEIVEQMLGLINTNTIIKFTKLIIANNTQEAIELIEEIYSKSSSLEYFVQAMADFMAHLCKAKTIINYNDPLYHEYSTDITDILVGTSLSRLSILWQIFVNGLNEIKKSHNELIATEMLVIKAIHTCNLPTIEEIMDVGSDYSSKEEKTTTSQEVTKEETADDIEQIFDFLKYCHNNSEMKIYYLLLNEVEIKNFSDNKIIVASKSNISSTSQIEALLKSWSGKKWDISIQKQDKIYSLKDKMHHKVKESGDYRAIKIYFPNADISDIILKS